MMLKQILMNTAAAAIGLVTGVQPGFASYALPINTKYISDIRTICDMSESAAEAKFKAEGFTMLKTDVNPTLDKPVYIGYKTTTDPGDAIRGLNFMNMRGKYSFSDYESALADHRAEVEDHIEGLIPTIEAYRKGYAAKTENALHAYEMLNHVYDFYSGEYMGDFLLNCPIENGNHDALTDVFLKGNGSIIMQIQRLLVMAGMTEKNCWLDRFEETSLEDLTAEYEATFYSASRGQKAMAQEYFLDAAVLLNQHWDIVYNAIRTVEEKYTVTEDGYDSTALVDELMQSRYGAPENADALTDEEAEQFASEKFGTEDMQQQFRSDMAVLIATMQENADLYDTLAMYEYNGEPMLDFFRRPKEEVEVEELYPLIASLSAGERGASAALGLTSLITQAGADDHWSDEREDVFRVWSDDSGEVSLYYGVNLKAFEEGVALTSEATKRDRSNSKMARWWEVFTDRNKAETATQHFAQPFTFLTLTAGCIAMSFVSMGLKKLVAQCIKTTCKTAVTAETATTGRAAVEYIFSPAIDDVLININPATQPIEFVKYDSGLATSAGSIGGSLYILFSWAIIVFYILAILSLVAAAVTAFMSLSYTAKYTKIPVAICDAWMGGNFTDYILYDAVEGLDKANMEFGDMNGYTEKYGGLFRDASVGWLVLYTTKDERAGDPITALQLTSGTDKVPLGYEGVRIFGEGTTVDLTDEKYTGQSNEKQIMLCCKRKPLSGTGTVTSTGIYAVTGGLALLGGGVIGALLGSRRKKKASAQPAEASV